MESAYLSRRRTYPAMSFQQEPVEIRTEALQVSYEFMFTQVSGIGVHNHSHVERETYYSLYLQGLFYYLTLDVSIHGVESG
jgi:hypothetical protein